MIPLNDFRCPSGHVTERFQKRMSLHIPCPSCGEEALKLPPLVALTSSSWGDQTGQFGVDGVYDASLRCNVLNEKHRDAILKERGLVRMTECSETLAGNVRHRSAVEAKQKQVDDIYYNALEQGKTTAEAQEMSTPAQAVLAGAFEDVY